jgi:hypothetical protein
MRQRLVSSCHSLQVKLLAPALSSTHLCVLHVSRVSSSICSNVCVHVYVICTFYLHNKWVGFTLFTGHEGPYLLCF